MKESAMPWVKIFTEIIDDPKIGRLSKAAKWRFLELIVLAGECDADGYLVHSDQPLTLDEIAWRLRDTRAQLESDLSELAAQELVKSDGGALTVINFSRRQGRSQNSKREQWKAHQAVRRDKVRSIVYKRSGGKCEYCDKPISEDAFVVEHITPPFRGGSYTSLDNLACACQRCNARKGDKTPEELGWKNPRAGDDSAKVIYDSDKVIALEGEERREEREGEESSSASATPTTAPPESPLQDPIPEEQTPQDPPPASEKKAHKKTRDVLLDHPAVVLYRELCHLTPNEVQRQLIADQVVDQTKWKTAINDWLAHGWNKANVPGMLDRYTNGQSGPPGGFKQSSEPKGFAAIHEAMQDPRYQE